MLNNPIEQSNSIIRQDIRVSQPIKAAPLKAFVFLILLNTLRTGGLLLLVLYLKSIYEFTMMISGLIFGGNLVFSWGACWILIDLGFMGLVQWRFGNRNCAAHMPATNRETVMKVVKELENPRSVESIENFFAGWFFGREPSQLSRGDILEWTACMIYNKRMEHLSSAETEDILYFLARLEKALRFRFAEGPSKAKKLLLTLDPVTFCHRPLLFYAGIRAADIYTRSALWRSGFIRKSQIGIVSYVRLGLSSQELPLIFFHGIGIGLYPYLRFILQILKRFPDRTVILFEKKSISMRLCSNHLLPEQYALRIRSTLAQLDINRVVVCGHSMGTVVICWLDHFYPDLIHGRLFLDPICFSLWTHDIAINFVYRKPGYIRHYLLKYIATLEPGISLYIRRYFV
jgi:hypothetical protein